MNKKIFGVVILLVVTVALIALFKPESRSLAPRQLGGDFTFNTADGEIKLADFKGKLVLLYFGYTSCPDICPTSLTSMKFAFKALSDEELAKIQAIFVSVDPERDTLAHLKTYSTFFSPKIIGATGSREQIDEAIEKYGAYYRFVKQDESAMEYTVDHSSRIYLINQQGAMVESVPHNNDPALLAEKIKSYLK